MASRSPNSEAVPKGPSTSGSNTAPSIKQQQNPKTQQNPRQQQQQRPVGNNADGAVAKKNPKEMTKAERRELQERQRAAKAAATANASAGGGAGGKGGTKSTPGGNNASTSQTSSRRRSIVGAGGAPPDTPSRPSHAHGHVAGADDTSGEAARGLRIFSHFGTPKPVSSKGSDVDRRAIHPAIIRLGLQFSGFKITGANARCIATLTAFKTVRISCDATFCASLLRVS